MSKTKDAQAIPAILDYLNKQNRPYSAVDILNNLHKEHGKTAIVKALDLLVAEGKIHSKTYNKQTVYVADQSQFPSMDDAELRSMEQQITLLTQKLKESIDAQRRLESELHTITSSLTTDEANAQLTELTSECARYEEKLKLIKSNANVVSPVERQEIMKARTTNVKEWRKRKRMGCDIIDAILEGYPKSKKELLEEVGVETDEDVGVKLPAS
jgi:26S proteasome regulatory subunit (ATPase 3-interacting protein)